MPDWAAISRAEKAQELASASATTIKSNAADAAAASSAQTSTIKLNIKKTTSSKLRDKTDEANVSLPKAAPRTELSLLERMSSVVIDEESGAQEIVPLPRINNDEFETIPKSGWSSRDDEDSYRPTSVPRRRPVKSHAVQPNNVSLETTSGQASAKSERVKPSKHSDKSNATKELQAEIDNERRKAADVKLRNQSGMAWASKDGESDDSASTRGSQRNNSRGGRRGRGKGLAQAATSERAVRSNLLDENLKKETNLVAKATVFSPFDPLPEGASWADSIDE